MKKLVVVTAQLTLNGRWDIDYHEPPTGITMFPETLLAPVTKSANIIRHTKNPTLEPDIAFQYVDIASVDIDAGIITRPQELTGEEAPSRARKVLSAYDIIISTCRPTRGAIAVVPEELHGQICSTGFSIIRAKKGINPYYLHFVLRMPSTLEQFRKWSTGSSYPAILDDDIAKTLIPLPDTATQDEIAKTVRYAYLQRDRAIQKANHEWETTATDIISNLSASSPQEETSLHEDVSVIYSVKQIQERIAYLKKFEVTKNQEEDTKEDIDEEEPYEQTTMFPLENTYKSKRKKLAPIQKNNRKNLKIFS